MTIHADIQLPTANFEMITPSIAQEFLLANTANRPFRKGHADALARDMFEGRYQINGDTIRFDRNGVLLDGQHRLTAIIMTEISQTLLVIRGLEPETMKTIDSGVKRTIGDRMALSGVKYPNQVAATLNIMNAFAHGVEKKNLTSSESYEVFDLHPNVEKSVAKAAGVKVVGRSYAAALHYIGTFIGYGDLADEFIEILRTGYCEKPNHPARVARERFIRGKDNKRKLDRPEQLEVLTSSWESARLGREVQVIRARLGDNRIRITGWDPEMLWGGI